MSGYFLRPVGIPDCPETDSQCRTEPEGIGLRGLCSEAWVIRYLPPAETILDSACKEFADPQRLRFIRAVPGGSDLLGAVQRGAIHGLEFATVLDDFDARRGGLFANAAVPGWSDGRNAGEVGLRFAHYPAWHQPFYLGWMIVNRSNVWERLDPGQRAAIEGAARESVAASFAASSSVQCEHLGRVLTINEGKLQRDGAGIETGSSADVILTRWRPEDLSRLRDSALRFLEGLKGDGSPSRDEADYATIITALHRYLGYVSIAEMLEAWSDTESLRSVECVS
jgi:hypothetical protein